MKMCNMASSIFHVTDVDRHNVEQTKCRTDKMSKDKMPNRQNVAKFFLFFFNFFFEKKCQKDNNNNLPRFSVATLFRS